MTAPPPSDCLPGTEKGATDSASAPGSLPERTGNEPESITPNEARTEDTADTEKSTGKEETLKEQAEEEKGSEEASAPPLPDEELPPPLPNEAPPGEDDGWEPVWDATAQAYYFYNRLTGVSQWENPRVPEPHSEAPGVESQQEQQPRSKSPVVGGYNPAIHGDYDPTAPYAQQYEQKHEQQHYPGGPVGAPGMDSIGSYEATGAFNRFTGKWQAATLTPENYNDENKSRRQMNAFFDVDAAANSHDGRSLRAERSAKKLTRKELKEFKEKRKERKEEKRRAWLRD
ncbi:hypothetical protein ASPWEDRAFT_35346 [Aspergillus wentii DTO 134E9]|uniref:WW domain-containing protein n=1 Tax=Aspergillus wentii DTO 134E9 TaxID=1073089 RepID=A0A1L9S3J9_ASPWE|nr:uncharacterized protein ASPWEDRAFT_35346 [Aspergillus wentii DTO 134E9]KAI9930080.1 hypothetical protein MW887_011890 [Aspergillus wentii]OJJ41742.1 hypothetical protein ASPWEDRAFT_35346 [Aspergillus wentii DTO 134E9]